MGEPGNVSNYLSIKISHLIKLKKKKIKAFII